MTTGNYWTRTRIGRRALFRSAGVGAAGLAGAALVGCGDDDDGDGAPTATAATTGTPAAAAPQPGGTFLDGAISSLGGFDLHNVFGAGGIAVPRIYNHLVRTSLIDPPPLDTVIFDLAESYELAADNVTWTFKLRSDAMVAPNDQGVAERPLVAEDVLANLARVADSGTGATGFRFVERRIASWAAPDDRTVQIVTDGPYAWTLEEIGDQRNLMIAPREFLESGDVTAGAVGGGPFMLTEADEQRGFVLQRNPNYYRSGVPYLDAYDYTRFTDPVAVRTAFEGDEIDIYPPTNLAERDGLLSAHPALQSFEFLTTAVQLFMTLNTVHSGGPWADPRARRAIHIGINRQEYVDIILEGGGEIMGVLSPAFQDLALPLDEVNELRPFDPQEAKRLFDAAEVTEFSLSYPAFGRTADNFNIFQKQMQELGITVDAETLDTAAWLAQYYANELPMTFASTASYATPDTLMGFDHTGGSFGNNTYDSGWSDLAYDEAMDTAATKVDPEEREQAYKDAQRLLLGKAPGKVRGYAATEFTLLSPRIRGYRVAPLLADTLAKELWVDGSA